MPVISLISALAVGQSLLCLSLLLSRPSQPTRGPLMVVIAACALILLSPAVDAFSAPVVMTARALGLWAHLILAPALWLYVEALTAESPWRFSKDQLWHGLPAANAIVLLVLVALLPPQTQQDLLIYGQAPKHSLALELALVAFLHILGWILQSVHYLWRIQKRLFTYRHRLKDLFANNDRRELRWLSVLAIALSALWLIVLINTAFDAITGVSLVPASALYIAAAACLWALCLFSLSQKAGFEGRYIAEAPPPAAKYRKSALTDEQAQRIITKLDTAMRDHQLYLDPTLSLPALAKRTAIPANHISQTLNEALGTTFFDYIGNWRIEAARPLLRDTDKTVLEISLEVGFNSKSAFYTAFRKVTGTTPTAFRKT